MTGDKPGNESGNAGGFSWGLTPGGAEPQPVPTPEPSSTKELKPEPGPTADPEATQLMQQEAGVLQPASSNTSAPGAPSASRTDAQSPLDSLFGESQFRDYEPGLAPTESPFASRSVASTPVIPAGPPVRLSATQKALLGVLGGLLALLALVALFVVGTRLRALADGQPAASPSASATPTPTVTPTPTPTSKPVGPVAVGVHRWDELLGGECLDPYTSPWAESFTVVDCGAAHRAQMVYRGTFEAAPAGPPPATSAAAATSPTPTPTAASSFPGAAALQAQISLLCAAPGVLDLAAAGQYADAQVQGSYPVTGAQWDAGQRDYFCFISRSSGQPLTGSVAFAKTP